MDLSDENFFEELVKEKASSEADFEVELAKATAANTRTHLPPPAAQAAGGHAAKSPQPLKLEDDEPEGQLAIDVYQTPTDIVVESAIAGVKPENIDVTVTSDSVTVKGERRRDREAKNDDYLYQECYWGRFSRSVILPQEVDPEKADVSFKNGILTIVMPKLNKKKSRKLKVKVE